MTTSFRRGTLDDSFTVYKIFAQSIEDFTRRTYGRNEEPGGDLAAWWQRRRSLFEHLARTADEFWLAEDDGQAIGYARSIRRDDMRELTECFVLPGRQSAGVGRELLARAFPPEGVRQRSIVATTDVRALGRYLRAGLYAHFPIYYFGGKPQAAPEATDLSIEPFERAQAVLDELRSIDKEIVGYTRDVDHTWLSQVAQGYLYRRDGRVVGYGYTSASNGPFALLEGSDFPAVFAHAEALAAARGDDEAGFEVPLINKAAVDFLLRRGYKMDAFYAFYMCDTPRGKLENYAVTSPPFFL